VKILCNENVPLLAVEALRELGHDVLWARQAMPGSSDVLVLERACAEGRLLVTFDKDFGELVHRAGQRASAGVVLFRIPLPSAVAVARQVALTLHSRNDWEGNFSVVEPGRVRMVPLPEIGKNGD
jgi:predicted nuclease of predicted toxin-antitoxin system